MSSISVFARTVRQTDRHTHTHTHTHTHKDTTKTRPALLSMADAQVKLKAKASDSYIARLTEKHDQPRFTIIEVELIGRSQWFCSAKCGRPLHVLTNIVPPVSSQRTHHRPNQPRQAFKAFTSISIHQMAPP